MPNNIPTEEQVTSVLQRWHSFRRKWTWLWFLSLFCLALYGLWANIHSPDFWVIFGLIWIVNRLMDQHAKHEFAKRMTREEFEILQQAHEKVKSYYIRGTIIELTKEYQHISPKQEYLRASNEPQEDTLLRAAAHTDNTPQEQLLRPSNDEEK